MTKQFIVKTNGPQSRAVIFLLITDADTDSSIIVITLQPITFAILMKMISNQLLYIRTLPIW